MVIDFKKREDVDKIAEKARDYFRNSPNGMRWTEQLYAIFDVKTAYLSPFLKKALKDIWMLADYYRPDDWWKCVVKSVDYFREKFEVASPLEVLRVNSEKTCGFDVHCDVIFSYDFKEMQPPEIVMERNLINYPDDNPPMANLVSNFAHEVWHAHQLERVMEFMQRHDSVLDFDKIDPTDAVNRGVIYLLSNLILYERDFINRSVCYRDQVCEAEAIYIQRQIETCLTNRQVL